MFFSYLQKALSITQTIESLETFKHLLLVEIPINIARNQEFFKAGEFSWN